MKAEGAMDVRKTAQQKGGRRTSNRIKQSSTRGQCAQFEQSPNTKRFIDDRWPWADEVNGINEERKSMHNS
jgi:hypothetical protein